MYLDANSYSACSCKYYAIRMFCGIKFVTLYPDKMSWHTVLLNTTNYVLSHYQHSYMYTVYIILVHCMGQLGMQSK